jgi:aminoglycoside 3-N-acetyltransferase
VIQGLLQAVGEEGTLLLPALSWSLRPPECFNVASTPTNVGAITEFFRSRPGTWRSVHPTHSVCAVGPRTHELLGEHPLDNTPCGVHSPFHKVLETNGQLVMLGCGLRPNTTMHALEEYVKPPYLLGQSFVFTLTDHEGRTYQKEYTTHGFAFHGYKQRYDKVIELATSPFLRRGKVLEADTFVLDAPKLKSAVLRKLQEDPFFFVEKAPPKAP